MEIAGSLLRSFWVETGAGWAHPPSNSPKNITTGVTIKQAETAIGKIRDCPLLLLFKQLYFTVHPFITIEGILLNQQAGVCSHIFNIPEQANNTKPACSK
jgi:hypothetical protein